MGYFHCITSGPPHLPLPQKKLGLAVCLSFDLAGLEENQKNGPLGAGQNTCLQFNTCTG